MADRLARCIESVRAQGYPAVQHIVIDASSTDGTVELLRSTRGVEWVSEADRGQGHALNKGFARAGGEILGWLNADDQLAPGSLERVVDAFRSRPEAGVVYGDIEVIEDGRATRVKPRGAMTTAGLRGGNVISQPGTFWTRAAWDRVGATIDESFHLTMDFELWLRFARTGVESVYLPEVLARFEVHPGSKTGSVPSRQFAEEEARALEKHGDFSGAASALQRWHWADAVAGVTSAMAEGDPHQARLLARQAQRTGVGGSKRVRAFIGLASVSPRLAMLSARAFSR